MLEYLEELKVRNEEEILAAKQVDEANEANEEKSDDEKSDDEISDNEDDDIDKTKTDK